MKKKETAKKLYKTVIKSKTDAKTKKKGAVE